MKYPHNYVKVNELKTIQAHQPVFGVAKTRFFNENTQKIRIKLKTKQPKETKRKIDSMVTKSLIIMRDRYYFQNITHALFLSPQKTQAA